MKKIAALLLSLVLLISCAASAENQALRLAADVQGQQLFDVRLVTGTDEDGCNTASLQGIIAGAMINAFAQISTEAITVGVNDQVYTLTPAAVGEAIGKLAQNLLGEQGMALIGYAQSEAFQADVQVVAGVLANEANRFASAAMAAGIVVIDPNGNMTITATPAILVETAKAYLSSLAGDTDTMMAVASLNIWKVLGMPAEMTAVQLASTLQDYVNQLYSQLCAVQLPAELDAVALVININADGTAQLAFNLAGMASLTALYNANGLTVQGNFNDGEEQCSFSLNAGINGLTVVVDAAGDDSYAKFDLTANENGLNANLDTKSYYDEYVKANVTATLAGLEATLNYDDGYDTIDMSLIANEGGVTFTATGTDGSEPIAINMVVTPGYVEYYVKAEGMEISMTENITGEGLLKIDLLVKEDGEVLGVGALTLSAVDFSLDGTLDVTNYGSSVKYAITGRLAAAENGYKYVITVTQNGEALATIELGLIVVDAENITLYITNGTETYSADVFFRASAEGYDAKLVVKANEAELANIIGSLYPAEEFAHVTGYVLTADEIMQLVGALINQ